MGNKKNTATENPNNATARGLYEAVVAKEGTVDGKPARIALYGTRYAALEVDGQVVHDCAFGGIRGIGQLKSYLDDEAAPVAVVAAPIAEAFGLTESPVVEVVPAFVEPTAPATPDVLVYAEPAQAPAEPVLATLDEVRAAFEAETRGACRASVLRALRVRAGEIALGLPAGGKAEKVKAEREASAESIKRTARMGIGEMIAAGIVKAGDEVSIKGKPEIKTTLDAAGNAADGRHLSKWCADVTGVSCNCYRSVFHVPSGKTLDELRS